MSKTTAAYAAELTPAEAHARIHKACAQKLQIFRDVAAANDCSLEVAAIALLIVSINGNNMILARIENSVDAMCGAAALDVLGIAVKGNQ